MHVAVTTAGPDWPYWTFGRFPKGLFDFVWVKWIEGPFENFLHRTPEGLFRASPGLNNCISCTNTVFSRGDDPFTLHCDIPLGQMSKCHYRTDVHGRSYQFILIWKRTISGKQICAYVLISCFTNTNTKTGELNTKIATGWMYFDWENQIFTSIRRGTRE